MNHVRFAAPAPAPRSGAQNGYPWALRLTMAGIGRCANAWDRLEGAGASLSVRREKARSPTAIKASC
jgi:hypothetical protein